MTQSPTESYDLIVVGTGFASTFFLHQYLRRAPASARILVLERGERLTHQEHLQERGRLSLEAEASIALAPHAKPWTFLLGFGGSSNCWWGNVPRMTPADFALRSRFGVGSDWPISYDDLEPYYCQAEELMSVAGPAQHAICPRSRPCPQSPHAFSEPDRLLQRAYPTEFFPMPSARPRRPTTGGRAACCGNGICHACPVDAKFTIQNEMSGVYRDPRVTLRLRARVDRVETRAGIATGIEYQAGGRDVVVRGELIALGANGIFNAHILLRSGFTDSQLGRGLTEQLGVYAVAWLDGVDNFGGTTSRCGHGYMLHRDASRHEHAAALVLTHNTLDVTGIRPRRGRWRQLLGLSIIYEDLRLPDNRITLDPNIPSRPVISHLQRSSYTEAALAALPATLERMLAPLPVEGFSILKVKPTEAHIIGATVMGTDPAESVLDPDLRHHTVRNLVVLGSGAFPTASPANPTLTLAALALRSADRILPPVRSAAA